MLRPLLVALALTAAPAVAQDLAGQYAAAARAFTLPGVASLGQSDLMEDDAVMAILPTIEGDWAAASVLFTDPFSVDASILQEACERTPSTLAQTAPRSFELRRSRSAGGQAISLSLRHDWVIGNTFDRSAAENEVIAYLGLDAMEEIPAGMLTLPGLRAEVQMFHPSADILVFAAPGQPPEILARCP